MSISSCSEHVKLRDTSSTSSSRLSANPLPRPPSANALRTSTGYPMRSATSIASSTVVAGYDSASFSWISSKRSLNSSRSSVSITVWIGVPSTCTPRRARSPLSYSAMPTFSAVCPPIDTSRQSGCSLSSTRFTNSVVTGRKYTLFARFFDVCTVAMFGFISTTSSPSSFSALIACEPL